MQRKYYHASVGIAPHQENCTGTHNLKNGAIKMSFKMALP